MKKILLSLITFCCFNFAFAELNINAKVSNLSKDIKDGIILITVSGGELPYTYLWSDINTNLQSNIAKELTEGVEYSVIVKDANGLNIEKTFVIEPESFQEHINIAFLPVVSFLDQIIFWDPFYALGIYDNKIRDNNEENKFKYAHGFSVAINFLQMIGLVFLLI